MPSNLLTELATVPTNRVPSPTAQQPKEATKPEGNTAPVDGKVMPPKDAPEPTRIEMEHLAERLSEFVKSTDRNLQFRVDDNSGRTVITVLDAATDEVIRQIPSEEVLRLADRLEEARSALFDGQA